VDPLTIKITNLDSPVTYEAPLFPREPQRGSRPVVLTPTIYIEKKDFKDELTEDFWGLAPGQQVGLKYASFALRFVERVGDELRVEAVELSAEDKPKQFIHWISDTDSKLVELRMYDYLFVSDNPNESDNWLDEINPNSLVTVPAARFPTQMAEQLTPGAHFQFERHGYFCVDTESTADHVIINKTVSL
jgi:glutaminyl-tRNA synthetase